MKLVVAMVCTFAGAGCMLEGTLPEPQKLWRSEPEALAPEPGPGTVTVGIGSIVNDVDGTTESFGLYQYLLAHPIDAHGARVAVDLVDRPADATYFVSGRVRGSIGYALDSQPAKGPSIAGIAMANVGVLGIAGSGAALAKSSSDDGKRGAIGAMAGFGVLTVSGAVLVGLAQLEVRNRYSWDQRAALSLRRGGKIIASFDVHAKGAHAGRDDLQGVHEAALAPIFAAIRARLAARIAADTAEDGE